MLSLIIIGERWGVTYGVRHVGEDEEGGVHKTGEYKTCTRRVRDVYETCTRLVRDLYETCLLSHHHPVKVSDAPIVGARIGAGRGVLGRRAEHRLTGGPCALPTLPRELRGISADPISRCGVPEPFT